MKGLEKYCNHFYLINDNLTFNSFQEANDEKKKEGPGSNPSPLWLGDELEFWPEKPVGNPIRCVVNKELNYKTSKRVFKRV